MLPASASAAACGKASAATRPVNHGRPHGEILRGEIAGNVAGAFRTGKIKKRRPLLEPLGGKPRKIVRAAARGDDVGKADVAHRLRAAFADREHRQTFKLGETLMPRNRRRRIGAGDEDRCPRSAAKLHFVHRLDAQERRDDRRVAARAQRGRGAFGVGLRPGHQQTHVTPARKSRRWRAGAILGRRRRRVPPPARGLLRARPPVPRCRRA